MADIEANKAKVREFYDRSHAGDLSVYDDMLSPSFVTHGGPAGEMRGPEAFEQAFVGFATAMSDFRTSIDMIIAEGDLWPCTAWPRTHACRRPATRCGGPAWPSTASTADGLIDGRWQEIDGLGCSASSACRRRRPARRRRVRPDGGELQVAGYGEMVMLNCCIACWPPSSVTRRVKVNVPAAVGVPVIRPGEVVRDSPGGSWPATSDHR